MDSEVEGFLLSACTKVLHGFGRDSRGVSLGGPKPGHRPSKIPQLRNIPYINYNSIPNMI